MGSAAVKLALQLGCRVVATTSSFAKAAAIRALAPAADGEDANLEVVVLGSREGGEGFHRAPALAGGSHRPRNA